jgi:uncharacterized membrane protein
MTTFNQYKLHYLLAILIVTMSIALTLPNWFGQAFSILIWIVGFIIIGSATFRKSVRTNIFWNWEDANYPSDQFEKMARLYGIVIFIWGFLLFVLLSIKNAI